MLLARIHHGWDTEERTVHLLMAVADEIELFTLKAEARASHAKKATVARDVWQLDMVIERCRIDRMDGLFGSGPNSRRCRYSGRPSGRAFVVPSDPKFHWEISAVIIAPYILVPCA